MLASDKGFTLIELMIVIAIIGILAAVAIPNFIAYRDKSYCSAAEKDANGLAATVSDYFAIPSNVSWQDTVLGDGVTPYTGGVATSGNQIVKWSALSGLNMAKINGPVESIVIEVTDGSKRCPDSYITAQKDAGWATFVSGGPNVFRKSMK